MVKKILISLGVLLLVLLVASFIFLRVSGAWNAIFPSSDHDTEVPVLPADIRQPAVLVFSKTNGFRHVDGIEGGKKRFEAIAEKHGWGYYETENGAVFTAENLKSFGTVVFNNASGDMLSEKQQQALQSWLETGGGWIGIHAAGDSSHEKWQWYVDTLIGVNFNAHTMGPQFQTATINVENKTHPATAPLPEVWQHEEEWYSWHASPRNKGFDILATIDENSYEPWAKFMGTNSDLRMGDHPIVWSRCIGKGRALYATMGHRSSAFDVPEIQQLLDGALEWTLGLAGEGCGS